MNHPLTPREKLKPCPFCGGPEHHVFNNPDEYGRPSHGIQCANGTCWISGPECETPEEAAQAWNRRTALASGSGDHAEQIEDAMEALQIIDAFPSNPGEVEGRITEKGGRMISSCTRDIRRAIEALLAEIAALNNYGRSVAKEALGYRARATEAERKLAEAVGLLRDLASWFDGSAYNGAWVIRSGDLGVDDAICAARTFLSKEAERG